jgi:hypothetical protein
MRLLIFKTDFRLQDSEKKGRLNSDRILIICFTLVFLLLMTVQAALTSQAVRERLYIDDELENSSNPDLMVLVNGDEVCSFSNRIISIRVRDGDVLELDGSGLDKQSEVKVLSKSDNVISDCINKKYLVKSGIREIARIRLNKKNK